MSLINSVFSKTCYFWEINWYVKKEKNAAYSDILGKIISPPSLPVSKVVKFEKIVS